MSPKLPKRPNLDHLRRQAKALLAALQRGDAAAARPFIEHLPGAGKLTPAKVRGAGFRLADAQSAVARQTGFASWPALSRHVRTLRALEGEWHFERLEIDGTAIPKAAHRQSRILIDGDCFRMESPEASYEGLFTIDVEAAPPRIDIEFVEGPEAGEWSYGIYRLDGDRVTFCLGLVGSPRPARFATSAGRGHALEELRRVSGTRPPNVTGGRRAAASKPVQMNDGPGAADRETFEGPPTPAIKRLAGDWKPLEMVQDGQRMQDDWLAYGVRVNTGNETKVVFGGQTMLHARMRIDEQESPIAIDYLNLAGRSKDRISAGIMEWAGEDVTFHIAAPGKPRPRDFVSAKGAGSTLSRWRRAT